MASGVVNSSQSNKNGLKKKRTYLSEEDSKIGINNTKRDRQSMYADSAYENHKKQTIVQSQIHEKIN